jgi:hypothetical protein
VTRKWLVLETALRRARSPVDPAEAARALKQAGVHVTRNSRGQWVTSWADQAARDWLAAVAAGTWTPPPPEPPPGPVAAEHAANRTGRHVFPGEAAAGA